MDRTEDTHRPGVEEQRRPAAGDDGPAPAPGRLVLPRYLVAAALARTADEGARVSLVLLALHATGSAAAGGTMVAALLVPHVVAAPLVGTLVDRARRPGRVLAALVLVFAAGLAAVAQLTGHAPLPLVLAVLLVAGCCGPAVTGGLTGQLPALVGPDAAPRAFGLDSLFYNVASMAGPALVGVVAAVAGPPTAQAVLAGAATAGALGVASLPLPRRTGVTAHERPGRWAGVREIVRQPVLRVVTVSSTLGQVGPGGLAVVAAVLASAAGRAAGGGLLLAAVAAGSLVGSLLWTWRPAPPERAPLVCTLSLLGIGAPLAVAAAVPGLGPVAVLFAVSGVFVGPFGSALFTTRTRYAPDAARTQVFTVGAGLKVTASAAGAALAGLVASLPGGTLLLLVAASPLLAGGLGTVLLLRGRRR